VAAHDPVDVAVLGPASWNEMLLLDQLPEQRPHTVFARASHETLGGTSAGKALHLTDLGVATRLLTPVAEDDRGQRVEDALVRAGVDLVVLPATGPTEHHVNLMTEAGERLSLYATPPADVRDRDLPALAALDGQRAVVLDLAPWTRRLAESAAGLGLPVWTDLHDHDGVDPWYEPFVAVSSHVFCSNDSLADPLAFLHAVVDGGATAAVCTLGADGAVAVDARHDEWRVAAAPLERVVDSNGAGDAFFAGVLAATLGGVDLAGALEQGARQAVRALGSTHLSPLVGDSQQTLGRTR
jgi:sugar/nucleoside kinase (ribokinase family)